MVDMGDDREVANVIHEFHQFMAINGNLSHWVPVLNTKKLSSPQGARAFAGHYRVSARIIAMATFYL